MWLRDHCRCPKCYHTLTRQRLVDTFSIPADIRPSSVVADDAQAQLTITWSHDNHQSILPLAWLRHHAYAPRLVKKPETRRKVLWNASLAEALPVTKFEDVMTSDEGLAHWLYNLDVYGFGIVDGCPPTPDVSPSLFHVPCPHESQNFQLNTGYRETHTENFIFKKDALR